MASTMSSMNASEAEATSSAANGSIKAAEPTSSAASGSTKAAEAVAPAAAGIGKKAPFWKAHGKLAHDVTAVPVVNGVRWSAPWNGAAKLEASVLQDTRQADLLPIGRVAGRFNYAQLAAQVRLQAATRAILPATAADPKQHWLAAAQVRSRKGALANLGLSFHAMAGVGGDGRAAVQVGAAHRNGDVAQTVRMLHRFGTGRALFTRYTVAGTYGPLTVGGSVAARVTTEGPGVCVTGEMGAEYRSDNFALGVRTRDHMEKIQLQAWRRWPSVRGSKPELDLKQAATSGTTEVGADVRWSMADGSVAPSSVSVGLRQTFPHGGHVRVQASTDGTMTTGMRFQNSVASSDYLELTTRTPALFYGPGRAAPQLGVTLSIGDP